MGYYCNGTVTIKGGRDILELIYVLAERLDDCEAISGFDADTDWLGHIFKQSYMEEGIFYEGGGMNKDSLELYIRASRTDGEDFFQAMASGLGVTIDWVYVSEIDDREHSIHCVPREGALKWELRTEEELDSEEDDEEDDPQSYSGGIWGAPHARSLEDSRSQRSTSPLGGSASISQMNLGVTSTIKTPSEVSAQQLAKSVYEHCFLAWTIMQKYHGTPDILIRSRICADMYIAVSDMLKLAVKALSSDELSQIASVMDLLSRGHDSLCKAFDCRSEDLLYTSLVSEDLPFTVVYNALRDIKYMATKVMRDYAVALSGFVIQARLW